MIAHGAPIRLRRVPRRSLQPGGRTRVRWCIQAACGQIRSHCRYAVEDFDGYSPYSGLPIRLYYPSPWCPVAGGLGKRLMLKRRRRTAHARIPPLRKTPAGRRVRIHCRRRVGGGPGTRLHRQDLSPDGAARVPRRFPSRFAVSRRSGKRASTTAGGRASDLPLLPKEGKP